MGNVERGEKKREIVEGQETRRLPNRGRAASILTSLSNRYNWGKKCVCVCICICICVYICTYIQNFAEIFKVI